MARIWTPLKKRLASFGQASRQLLFETWTLLLPLCGLGIICFLLWRFTRAQDFGLNAFTEILGIILTVIVIDRLIKHQNYVRSLPLQAAAFEDVRLLITGIIYFWVEVYWSTIPRPSPARVEDLFSEDVFREIKSNLDLDSQPRVSPVCTWWTYFASQQQEFRRLGERILERHAGNLDPSAYAHVHQIVMGSMDPSLMFAGRQSDMQAKFPRPTLLGSYWNHDENFFPAMLALHKWCVETEKKLHSRGLNTAAPAPNLLDVRPPSNPPRGRITPERLQQQLAAVADFRKKHDYIDPTGRYDKKQSSD